MIASRKNTKWRMLVAVVLLAGVSLALPTPEPEETDGEVSRKILGSSVVTSVSVIMDVGNGSQTFFSDAVGKPMTKPSAASQLASPINLLNPDRYEFYTFDDSGDLVKRLMTLDEIQGIIASGDGEASNYNSQSGDEPEKRVDDVVNNVQNVLKEEMEAHKTSGERPAFDTPDVTSSWNMILPAIFGNSGDEIIPQKPQASITAETIMIEPTTLLPVVNESLMRTEQAEVYETTKTNVFTITVPDVTTEVTSQEEEKVDRTDAPLISVEITNVNEDGQSPDSKTESSYVNGVKSTTEQAKVASILYNEQDTQRPAIIISTPSPFTYKVETTSITEESPLSTTNNQAQYSTSTTLSPISSSTSQKLSTTIVSSTFNQPPPIVSTTSVVPPSTQAPTTSTSSVLITSSTFPPTTLLASPTTPPSQTSTPHTISTPHGQLSTFFLIEDNKHKQESTTKPYSTPAPFTLMTQTSTTRNNLYRNPPSTTTKSQETTRFYARPFTTTQAYATTQIDLAKEDAVELNQGLVQRTTTLVTEDKSATSSTEETTKVTTQNLQTSTNDEYVRFSTIEDASEPSTTENLVGQTYTEEQPQKPVQTTEGNDAAEQLAVTELLNQLLLTTNVQQINSELLKDSPITTEKTVDQFTALNEAATSSTTERIKQTEQTETPTTITQNETATEPNLVLSIEQLISQAVNNPEQTIENVDESEKVNQLLNNGSKPMSVVQVETATAASALVGPSEDNKVGLGDEQVNQAVDSLISQIIYQPSQTTIEDYSTTTTRNEQTTISPDSDPDDRNRYEEMDLDLDSQTEKHESKTEQSILSNETTINYDHNNLDRTSTELNQEETKYPSTLYPETIVTASQSEKQTTEQYEETSSLTEKLNDIFNSEASELNPENYSTTKDSSESFLIVASSSEYPDYASTENIDVYAQTDKTTSAKITEAFTELPTTQSLSSTKTILPEDDGSAVNKLRTPTSEKNISQTTELNLVTKAQEQTTQQNDQTIVYIIEDEPQTPPQGSTSLQSTSQVSASDDTTNKPQQTTQVLQSENPSQGLYNQTELQPKATTQQPEDLQTEANLQKTTTENHETTATNLANSEPSQSFQTYQATQANIFVEVQNQTTQQVDQTTETKFFTETQTPSQGIPGDLTTSVSDKALKQTTPEFDHSTTEMNEVRQTTVFNLRNEPQKRTTQHFLDDQTTETNLADLQNQHQQTNETGNYTTTTASSQTSSFVNLPTLTAVPKIEKPAELKLITSSTSKPSTTSKADMTWTLVSTVMPHKTNEETKTQSPNHQVDLVPKPLQGFGLEDSTSALDTDVFQFTELCNELAFSFWSSVTSGISFARGVIVSPFAATSMLAMVFLGARGSTSGEMNEILKLDDMVTFNPHSIFKNVIESIEVSKKSGVAVSVFVKELYSDKNKGKLLSFYKERVKQFYDGHVEEANFREINDVIRRRTNLLVKRQTWGKIPEYLKDNNLFVRPPLAAVSANIFQTDCSEASTEGRDGELHFVVLPSIRQRKLVPIPAVVWRSGFLAGYDPGLDATAVAVGTKDQTVSTIFVIPGQQGISAPGDGLMRLEARLIDSAFRQGAWSRLLRSLIPRPGLEVQIPRFSHKSVINATMALQRMGLKDLFNSNTADLKGLNGVAHELYLSDIIQVNTFATCGEGRIDETHHSEVYPATTNRSYRRIRKIHHYHGEKQLEHVDMSEEPRDYQRAFHDPLYDPSYLSLPLQLRPRQARLPDAPRLRFDRPFLYFVRHNPTGLILHMGRFNPRLLP